MHTGSRLLGLILTGLGNGWAGHVHAHRNSGACNVSKVNGEARDGELGLNSEMVSSVKIRSNLHRTSGTLISVKKSQCILADPQFLQQTPQSGVHSSHDDLTTEGRFGCGRKGTPHAKIDEDNKCSLLSAYSVPSPMLRIGYTISELSHLVHTTALAQSDFP